ncbi:hypothetical protein Tco_0673068 [Tanacetum coccineum]
MCGEECINDTPFWCYRREGCFGVVVDSNVIRKNVEVTPIFLTTPTIPSALHINAQHLLDCLSGAVVANSDELVSSITQVVSLFLDGKFPKILDEYIVSASFTPLVKPGGGIRPIAMGTVWRLLVSNVSAVMICHSLDGYIDELRFSVGVSGGGEAILYAMNCSTKDRRDDVGLSMLLVDSKNAFNLVDRKVMLQEVRLRCLAISRSVEFCL